MSANRKKLSTGIALLATFCVVLAVFFSPVIEGQSGLEFLDSLYNSISKGSAYYIPKLREEAKPLAGEKVELAFGMANPAQAEQTAKLFMASGALVNVSGAGLKIAGDLGKILDNCLADADFLYRNDDQALEAKYGVNGRQVLFDWWQALKGIEKDLTHQKKFREAKAAAAISKKAVETAYNYFQVAPQSIMDRLGVVIFSLLFYVIYTLWYGFGILYLFEGLGMQLEH